MQKITPAQLWYAVQVYSSSISPEKAQKIYDQNVSELHKQYWCNILKKIYLLCNPLRKENVKKVKGTSFRRKGVKEIEYE